MHYFATHYWQSDHADSNALVLQQAYHTQKKIPVLLAGVEERARQTESLCRSLADWFYTSCLPFCSRHGEKKQYALAEELIGVCQTHVCAGFTGILCVGKTFICFGRGKQNLLLLNTRNNRAGCRMPVWTQQVHDAWYVQVGLLQRGVGILLLTDGFHDAVSSHMLESGLNIRDLRSQSKAEGHLRELGVYGQLQGGIGMGAILVVTQ